MSETVTEAAPPATARTSLVVNFGRDGDADAFIREGWGPPGPELRWSIGERNLLVLPTLAPSRRFALTLDCDPAPWGAPHQSLALELNGVAVARLQPKRGVPQSFVVPGDIVRDLGENTLVCHNPDVVAPADRLPGNRDTRKFAFAWRRLELSPDAAPPFGEPEPLPEADPEALNMQVAVTLFQSLGQNCELGIFQRRFGAEPAGLLRFAGISPEMLVRGLRRRFAGIDAPDELTISARTTGGELMGRHAMYGFAYHTFRKEGEIDVVEFKVKELRRLAYLVRLFNEQIDNDEKVFVHVHGFEAEGELRALYLLLKSFNANARLLIIRAAPVGEPERAGRVERIAPDLYRGYLSQFADPQRVPSTIAYEDWRKVCATLYLDQQNAGRVELPA